MTLEERVIRLEDTEAIRYLQAKYQRSLDTRDFDSLAECFAEDVVSSYGNGSMSYKGKDAVMEFLIGAMTPSMPSTHLIHGGEIDILSSYEAEAKWYLEDYLLHQKYKMKLHGAAIYEVKYIKLPAAQLAARNSATAENLPAGNSATAENSPAGNSATAENLPAGAERVDGCRGWKISSIGYKRCYEYMEMRGPVNLITLGKKSFIKSLKEGGVARLGRYGAMLYNKWFHK